MSQIQANSIVYPQPHPFDHIYVDSMGFLVNLLDGVSRSCQAESTMFIDQKGQH